MIRFCQYIPSIFCTRHVPVVFILLLLIWGGKYTRIHAVPPVKPKSEISIIERDEKPLQAHIDIRQGNQEDSLLLALASDSLFISTDTPRNDTFPGMLIEADKKIIYPQAIGLTATNTLREILEFIPELLSRGNEDLLVNFSLQIDDQDVGLSKNVLLSTMRLSEIESIEIIPSPTASVQKNGEGGVINIHLKPVAKGLSGSAGNDLYTNFRNTVYLSPAVFINYGRDKWQMRTSLLFDYYRPEQHEQREIYTRDEATVQGRDTLTQIQDTSRIHSLRETAKLHIDYQPAERDKLSFVVMESMQWRSAATRSLTQTNRPVAGSDDLFRQSETLILQDHKRTQLNLLSQIKYKHDYLTGGRFETSMLYTYRDQNEQSIKSYPILSGNLTLPRTEQSENTGTPHELQLNISTKHPVCPQLLGLYDSEMWLTLELNTSYTDRRANVWQKGISGSIADYEQRLSLLSRQLYVSPVVQWDYRIGSVKMQAGVRYQMLRRRMSTHETPDWTKHEHDITANINAAWQVTREHSLRLAVARNIVRPQDEQLFPYTYYLPATQELMVGNDSLHSAYFHNISINYLYSHDFSHAKEGRIITNIGLEYIRADGMIRKQRRTYSSPYGLIPYKTYVNQSIGNVISAAASVFLRYKIFSLSFSGNLYANLQQSGSTENYYWYYNLSVAPFFAFRRHWMLSGKLMYNSRIETDSSLMGDCLYAQLRLSKDIGNWNIHAELSDMFDIQTLDRSISTTEHYTTGEGGIVTSNRQHEVITRTYDLYKRLIMIGAVYKF